MHIQEGRNSPGRKDISADAGTILYDSCKSYPSYLSLSFALFRIIAADVREATVQADI